MVLPALSGAIQTRPEAIVPATAILHAMADRSGQEASCRYPRPYGAKALMTEALWSVALGSIRVYEVRTRTFVGAAARELKPDGTFRISGLEPGERG